MNRPSLLGHVLELLPKTDGHDQPVDKTVSRFLRDRTYIGARDRRFITESVYGILRNRRLLEALLEQYVKEHPSDGNLDSSPGRYMTILMVFGLVIGFGEDKDRTFPQSMWDTGYSGIPLARVADWMSEHASLDFLSTESLVVRRGVRHSFQDWMVQEWQDCLGDESEMLLASMNDAAPTTLRVNLLKARREECQERLRHAGIETIPTECSPAGLRAAKRFTANSVPEFREGWFELQDEGSQLVSLFAAPRPGWVVIDACAGAGGKTLHLAELMGNQGSILAVDTDAWRLEELRRRLSRSGVSIVTTSLAGNVKEEEWSGRANLVLVDAPCSGVGTIRRNPSLKWTVTPEMVGRFAERQKGILSKYAPLVAPGGILVYATCSLLKEENNGVIDAFIHGRKDFVPECLDAGTVPAAVTGRGLTLYPHRVGSDGYFISALRHAG